MDLKTVFLVILYGMTFGVAEDTEETEESADSPPAEYDEDLDVPLTVGARLQDIDVLCSKLAPNSTDRLWTWLDVSDLNVMGYWREYGICIDKNGLTRFRFRAFELNHPPSYDIVQERCRESGYEYAQPARLYPERAVNSFGWPDRGYVGGIYGPSSYQLGSGRSDTVWERRQEAAYDGWYLFRIDEEIFTPGFISVDPCKRVQLVAQPFQLEEIPCQNYRRCPSKV